MRDIHGCRDGRCLLMRRGGRRDARIATWLIETDTESTSRTFARAASLLTPSSGSATRNITGRVHKSQTCSCHTLGAYALRRLHPQPFQWRACEYLAHIQVQSHVCSNIMKIPIKYKLAENCIMPIIKCSAEMCNISYLRTASNQTQPKLLYLEVPRFSVHVTRCFR